MKKNLHKFFFYISILMAFFSGFWMLYQYSNTVNEMKLIKEPISNSRMDKIYVPDNDTILIHNYICGIIQCFDFNGNFKWGVHLQTTKDIDDTLISYDENRIYLWEGKTKTIYNYANDKLEIKEIKKEITDKDKFYEAYPLKSQKYVCKFKVNGTLSIKNTDGNETKIKLDNTFNHYSFIEALFGLLINSAIFIFIKKRYFV